MRGNSTHSIRFAAAVENKQTYMVISISEIVMGRQIIECKCAIPIEGLVLDKGIEAAVFKSTPPYIPPSLYLASCGDHKPSKASV